MCGTYAPGTTPTVWKPSPSSIGCIWAAPAVASLKSVPGLRFLHRRANLEDLFLKLTGREMRDDA